MFSIQGFGGHLRTVVSDIYDSYDAKKLDYRSVDDSLIVHPTHMSTHMSCFPTRVGLVLSPLSHSKVIRSVLPSDKI